MPRGAPAPIASGIDQRSKLDGSLGDSNFQPRAIGFGKVAHGNDVGNHDAVYVTFGISSTKANYEVQHSLGRVAGFAMKVHTLNPRGVMHTSVEPIDRDKWTTNTVRVNVILVGPGSLDGGEVTLMIGGEQ
jgi:hypothetical protein